MARAIYGRTIFLKYEYDSTFKNIMQAASSESEEIHRTMDREEIIRYFDVDHHDKGNLCGDFIL